MRCLAIFLILLMLASCGGKKAAAPSIDRIVKDSMVVTRTIETVYDTITIPRDSVTIIKRFQDLTATPQIVRSSNGRSSVSLSRKRDTIIAHANCEQKDSIISSQKETIETLRTKDTKEIITLPPVKERYVPLLVKILAWIGGLLLAVIGLSAVLKSFNPFSLITNITRS